MTTFNCPFSDFSTLPFLDTMETLIDVFHFSILKKHLPHLPKFPSSNNKLEDELITNNQSIIRSEIEMKIKRMFIIHSYICLLNNQLKDLRTTSHFPSENETFEDIITSTLPLLSIEFFIGTLYQRLSDYILEVELTLFKLDDKMNFSSNTLILSNNSLDNKCFIDVKLRDFINNILNIISKSEMCNNNNNIRRRRSDGEQINNNIFPSVLALKLKAEFLISSDFCFKRFICLYRRISINKEEDKEDKFKEREFLIRISCRISELEEGVISMIKDFRREKGKVNDNIKRKGKEMEVSDLNNEEEMRESYLLFLEYLFCKAQSDSRLRKMEMQSIENLIKTREEGNETLNDPPIKKLWSYLINASGEKVPIKTLASDVSNNYTHKNPQLYSPMVKRMDYQSSIFRPDISLPTMSLKTFAEMEMRSMVNSNNIINHIRTDDNLEDSDNSEKESETRNWDDWKDCNPRGSGNTMHNRG